MSLRQGPTLSARQRQLREMSGSAAASIMSLGSSKPMAQANYAHQNRERIQYMQSLVKAREIQREEAAMQMPFKMGRFADVESRVFQDPRVSGISRRDNEPSIHVDEGIGSLTLGGPVRRSGMSTSVDRAAFSVRRTSTPQAGFGSLAPTRPHQQGGLSGGGHRGPRTQAYDDDNSAEKAHFDTATEAFVDPVAAETDPEAYARYSPMHAASQLHDIPHFYLDNGNTSGSQSQDINLRQSGPVARPSLQNTQGAGPSEISEVEESVFSTNTGQASDARTVEYSTESVPVQSRRDFGGVRSTNRRGSAEYSRSQASSSGQERTSKPPLPSAEELARAAARTSEEATKPAPNFVAHNATSAIQSSRIRTSSLSDEPNVGPGAGAGLRNVHQDFGRVPQYLRERQAQMAADEEALRVRQEQEKEPLGMVRMPEEQRLSTLQVLEEKRGALMQTLAAFPLVIETESRRRRKGELEAQLSKLEQMIAALNHDVVYVKP